MTGPAPRYAKIAGFAAALLAVGVTLSVSLASQSADPPIPTFRAEVEYVEVDALVTDEQGHFVPNLQKEDFRIFEDEKPQTIANFALVEIPMDRGLRLGGAEPDVLSNERPFIGRIYTMILDDLHTAPSRAPLVKAAARRFIERHLAVNDLMAIVHIAGRTQSSQEFTSNKRLLLAAVDRFMGQKLESATLARNTEFLQGPYTGDGRVSDPFDSERSFNARSTTRGLRTVAEWLGGVRGRRKTILFISEGIDYDITDPFNNRSATAILDEMRGAIAAATRSNVSIYTIDPRGLTAGTDDLIEAGILGDQLPRTYQGDADTPSGTQARPGIGTGNLRTELQLSQDSLRTLADETNGFAAVNSNDFGSAFDRIVSDNSSYYVLAYYPPSNRRDGKFHRIEVRTSRPGLRVRARRGYASPKGNPPAQGVMNNGGASPVVLRALNSPLPTSGLTMRMFVAPFKGVAPNASVVFGIELRGRDLTLEGGNRVELSYVAIDASGQTRGDTDFFTLKLPPETKAHVERTGIRVLRRFDLPPGRYQLRVAAHDIAGERVGGLNYDLEVPDYGKLPFSMSGLLLTSRAGTTTLTARPDELLQRSMPAPPVALRAFPQEDEVLVFAEVYDRTAATPHDVDITTTVTSNGAVVWKHSDQRSSSELQGTSGGYGHTVRVPMSGLQPGSYVLNVEARSRLGPAASREIPFEVVAPTP
jgi:VWFA-related protein